MKDKDFFYTMPHSVEAEMAFLGCLIIENEKWNDIIDILNDDDFYQEKNRIVFFAMKELANNNEPIDVIMIFNVLRKNNIVHKIGSESYLEDLINSVSDVNNIFSYLNILRETSLSRRFILAAKEIIQLSLNNKNKNIDELIDAVEKKILTVSREFSNKNNKTVLDISTVLRSTIEKIETLYHSGRRITGVSTGFAELDDLTTGLHPAELIVIAGRPSMGKTALALNIAENVLINHNLPVLIFSMEMSAEQIVTRMLSSLGDIELHHLKNGQFVDSDWPRLAGSVSNLSGRSLFIDDSGTLNPFDVKTRARAVYQRCNKLGLIIIDYLQLMEMPGAKESKNNEISEISRALKIFSKELQVPIIVLSQLNRGLEQRIDKRPIMSDLRSSGAIEQDADLILFIYRDEIYNRNNDMPGMSEIIIAKQRNGPTGVIKLFFDGQFAKFIDLDKKENNKNNNYDKYYNDDYYDDGEEFD